jgi:decaprenyl-phosphate phosphoribosyltransferase
LTGSLLRAARPRQWSKNVLVFAAPAAAGVLSEPDALRVTFTAFVAFCLAASGTYYLNDVVYVAADRAHPRKRLRPIAAGRVPLPAAVAVGILLLGSGLGLAAFTGSGGFLIAMATYVALTVGYTLWLKRLPVIEIMAVASGFIIRAAAGGLALDLPLSEWFLIVASFGALFVVTGKRHAELLTLGDSSATHRGVLSAYTVDFTRHVLTLSAGITLVAYCLWAFEPPRVEGGRLWVTLSIVPFVAAFLRYALLVLSGEGGEPEEVLLSDRALQGMGVVWVALLGTGIALG